MKKMGRITEKIKKHKKLTVLGVVILVIAIVGTMVVSNAGKKKQQMMAAMNQTQTSRLERRTLVSSVSATGTLTSADSKQVTVNLSGVEVKSVSVELGDMVEAGQVLCEFDSEDIAKNLADAKTALNVTNQKTQMSLTEAQRNLENAKEDYDTDLKRSNTDLGVAYNDYAEALEDVEEAKEDWEEAKAATIEKKGEYEYRKEQLEQLQTSLGNLESSGTYNAEFERIKGNLESYVKNSGGTVVSNGGTDKIYISNASLSQVTVGNGSNYDFSASDTDKETEVKNYINSLVQMQSNYNKSLQLEALQSEVNEWQTKYNNAKQSESAAENTYEQQVSASQSKLQAYQKQQRTVEDTEKNAENSVISKTDSLTTAQLNAMTSGTSEEAKVEEYEQQLEDCTVTAPISGVISAVNIEAGDTYNGSAIVTIDDVSSFEITTEIDEYDIYKIEKGQKVVIKTNATGDEELEGTVKRVSPKASSGSNEVTYTVIISVDTPNEMLRMDMTAKLSIILESKENVLTVPYEAVQEDEEGNTYIEVADSSMQNMQAEKTDSDMTKTEEKENEEKMPEGQMPEADKNSFPQNKEGMPGGNMPAQSDMATRRIYVEKGIESDYYIEVISDEISEGMEVVVPKTENENGGGIQMMMMQQGPMGGF